MLPDTEQMKRRLAMLAQLEEQGQDIGALSPYRAGPEMDAMGKRRVVTGPQDADLEAITPVSALGRPSAPVPVAAPVEFKPAGIRDEELENAKNLDAESRSNRLFEAATRQLIAGITRTPVQGALTEKTNEQGSLLSRRRQGTMDALKQLEMKRGDEKFAFDKEKDARDSKWRASEADENQELRREGIAASRASSEAMRAIAGANLGLGMRREEREVENAAPKAAAELRKEFNQLPDVKQFGEVETAYQKVKSAAGDPSAAGDLSAIFAYMKMLDPGSSVREGEFANAQNAAGIDQKVVGKYNQIMKGERLSPEQRNDFIRQAEKLFQTHKSRYDMQAKRYRDLATRNKTNPDDVIVGPPVKVTVSNGTETLQIDPSDLAAAEKDGYRRVGK